MTRRIVLVAITLLIAAAGMPATAVPRLPLKAALDKAIAACPAGASGCVADAADAVLEPLRSDIGRTPKGRAGPAAWIRLAARIRDYEIPSVPRPRPGLREAIFGLYRQAGVPMDATLRASVDETIASVPAAQAEAVARLVSAVARAGSLAESATSDADLGPLIANPVRAHHLATLASTRPTREWDAIASQLSRVDMPEMTAAALELAEAVAALDDSELTVPIDLPFIFVGGEGDTAHTQNRLLLVDVSGNDTYTNNAGGGLISIFGGSLAIDLGDGNDTYTAQMGAQGYGAGAAGILYDEGGIDSYSVTQFGQGSSVAGAGILYDAGGEADSYLSPATADLDPIGTKASSLGGIGIIVDEGGSDVFHQDGLDGLIWAAAGGTVLLASLGPGNDTYRADSIEVDLLGMVDTFAGPVQVSAEVDGVAILYEEEGDDGYTCGVRVRQGCQGSAGGGSLGLLWDVAGNDTYWMGDSVSVDIVKQLLGDVSPLEHPVFPMGQGIGYGLVIPGTSPALGILRDEGGADRYTAARWAQGYGTFGGVGVLYDSGGGVDSYQTQPPFNGSRADGSDWIDGLVGLGLDR